LHHQTDSEPRLKNDSITWDGSAGRVTDTLQRNFNKIEDYFYPLYHMAHMSIYLFAGKSILNISEHVKHSHEITSLQAYSMKLQFH